MHAPTEWNTDFTLTDMTRSNSSGVTSRVGYSTPDVVSIVDKNEEIAQKTNPQVEFPNVRTLFL